MRALSFAGPAPDTSTSTVTDLPEPAPGAGQVAIRVAYAGVNFIDVMARRGDPGYAAGWPYVPGLEVAGTVTAVGAGVDPARVGRQVAGFTTGGGLAEVALASAGLTVDVPAGVPLEQAAAAPLAGVTAVLLLTEVARLAPGETVLMHSAAGGVGSLVAQLARVLGAGPLIGTAGRAGRPAPGWDDLLPRDAGWVDAVHALAPSGVDVVLDPTGSALLDLDLQITAPGGRIVLFGNAAGGAPVDLPAAGRLIAGNVGLFGLSVSRLSAAAPHRVAGALGRALELIAAGDLQPQVTVLDGLDAAPAAHDLLASGRNAGKQVVRVAG